MAGRSIAVVSSLVANAAVATIKFVAAVFTGSSAMLAEAVHSLVDMSDSVLLMVGQHRSRKAPDRTHPLGYGREIYFWSMVVAMVIFGAGGCFNVFEGIHRIRSPQPTDHIMWTYGVLGASLIPDLVSFVIGLRQFRREFPHSGFFRSLRMSKDPTTFAVVLEDVADITGVVAAFLGIWLGNLLHMPMLDGVASVLIGVLLGVVAFLLGRECHGLLIGESADENVLTQIMNAARAIGGVIDVGPPVTIYYGPKDLNLALSVRFRDDLDARKLAGTIDEMEAAIREAVPEVRRIFVEAELNVEQASRRPKLEGARGRDAVEPALRAG